MANTFIIVKRMVMVAGLTFTMASFTNITHASTLKVAFLGTGPSSYSINTIKLFNQVHPEVKVVPVYITYKNLPRLVKEKCDAYIGDPWVVEDGLKYNLIEDLSKVLPKRTIDCIRPNLLAPYTVGKKLVALPTGGQAQNFAYNQTMFAKAGIPIPDYNWTWKDHVFPLCSKLAKDIDGDGVLDEYGLPFLRGYGWEWLTILFSHGGQIIDAERKNKVYGKGGSAEALSLMTDMVKGKTMAFVDDWNLDSTTGHPFYTGKSAIRLLWNHSSESYQEYFDNEGINVKIGMTSVPKGPRGSVPIVVCGAACIFKGGANRKDAVLFVQHLVDKKRQRLPDVLREGILPTNVEALMSKEIADILPAWYVNSFMNGRERSRDPKCQGAEETMWEDFYQVGNGKMTLQELLAKGK